MTLMPKELVWGNKDNASIYDEIDLNFFYQFAEIAGLDSHSDLRVIHNYLVESEQILEIGGGVGRVLDYLILKNYSKNIVTIERCQKLYNFLKTKYLNKVDVIYGDIATYKFNKEFDCILWMWGSFCEFSRCEQPHILKKIISLLCKKGRLFLDITDENKPLNVVESNDKTHSITCNTKSVLKGFIPSFEDFEFYVSGLDGVRLDFVRYQTTKGIKRIMYIITKQY